MGNGVLSKDFAGDGNNAVVTSGIGASDSSKGTVSLWFNRPASASTDEFLYHRVRGSTVGTLATDYSNVTPNNYERGADLTGNADGTQGICSFWFFPVLTASEQIIYQSTDPSRVTPTKISWESVFQGFRFDFRRDTGSIGWSLVSQLGGALPVGVWHHILVSWDMAGPIPISYFINDVLALGSNSFNPIATIGHTAAEHSIGDSVVGGNPLQSCISEFYLGYNQHLDFSSIPNRRKFIDAAGNPADLGSDGSTPTGTAPHIYLPSGDGPVNAGSGGNFTLFGPAPVPCATFPGVDESDGVKYVSADNSVRVSLNSEPGTVSGTAATDYAGAGNIASAASLSGLVDGDKGIMSVWFLVTNVNTFIYEGSFFSGPNSFGHGLRVLNANLLQLQLTTSIIGIALRLRTTTPVVTGTWNHFLASWDITAGVQHLYLNDNEDLGSTINNPGTIDYTRTTHSIGGGVATFPSGDNEYSGCLSEVYINFSEFLDFSVLANRRKFIDGSGNPVNLGATGSVPTTNAPIMYFPNGDPTVNAGTGGNFTQPGLTAACATVPGPDNRVVDISSMGGISTGAWHHLLASWDHTSVPLKSNLHIDDVDDIDVAGTGNRVGTIDHSALLQAIAGTQTGVFEYGGCLSEVYFSTEFIDTDILSNRRLFIDASGLPVELGSDGSLPLAGTPPIIYLPDGDPAANAGSGGNFVQNGTIAACATVPSPALDARTIIEIVRDEIDAAGLVETDKFLILRLGFAESFLTDALSFFDASDLRKTAKGVRKAVKFLELAVEKGFDAATVTDWGERLCGAIRQIASDEIDAAIARTGDPIKIAEAQDAFADGETEKLFEEFLDAIRDYEKAIKSAIVA